MKNMDNTKEILYEYLGRSKYEWLRSGKQLIAASNILYNESTKAGDALNDFLDKAGAASEDEFIEARAFIPARMITGMAFENLIKGLILIKHPEKVSKDKKFDLKSHNLVQLWTMYLPEIGITEKEKAVLKELENYIAWKGRYPIPLIAKDFKPSVFIEGETTLINSMYAKLLKGFE
jgi:hypothetical protein